MERIKNLARAVGKSLGEKHRRAAALNRIRTVIRCEERAAEKEYLALGRYYYHTLRDRANGVTEPHCQALDGIEQRLDAALSRMQAVASEKCGGVWEEIDLADVECLDEELGEEADLPFEG